jgi:hypothetical protein
MVATVTVALASAQAWASTPAQERHDPVRDDTARADISRSGARRARTLEAITIEGTIDAPEVQFITSRDRLRFADDAGRLYRPDVAAVLDSLRVPVRLRVVAPPGCPPFETTPSR